MTAYMRLLNAYSTMISSGDMEVNQVPKEFLKKNYVDRISLEEITIHDVPEEFKSAVEYMINNPSEDYTAGYEQALLDLAEV